MGDLQVGIGVCEIPPLMERYDTWTDVNGNDASDPKIDTYVDVNNNHIVDLVWLAGFGRNPPAQGINDPLSSRATAFRNKGMRSALTVLASPTINIFLFAKW